MIIQLSLTAPEHVHLIEHYNDFFREDHAFSLDWSYPALPGVGQSFEETFITDLLKEHVNIDMLPHTWTIVDLKWYKDAMGIVPRLYVVGK